MLIRRLLFVYGGLLVVLAIRVAKRRCVRIGEFLKSLGRKFVSLGEEETMRWSTELLLQCYMVDAEFHIDGVIYRGPVYAVYRGFVGGNTLVFRCNWIATCRDRSAQLWDYAGGGAFRIEEYSAPAKLPNGDYHFGFQGGYGVLFLGRPRSRLSFIGHVDTPREFAYF